MRVDGRGRGGETDSRAAAGFDVRDEERDGGGRRGEEGWTVVRDGNAAAAATTGATATRG